MKLISLKLENFQGVKAASFEFDGHNATIYGDNATGKTTVFNAVTWILFGSASTGAKGYTPKTKSTNGDMHNLNHVSTAVFELDNGRILTLSKNFHEVYKKKKGSPVEEFSGHTTDYFVDGVPAKEKEYQAAIANICDGEQFKILTMPHYFSETMTWEARRKLLLEVCGEVDDNEIMSTVPELAELKELLKAPGTSEHHYTVDGFKKVAGSKKTAINKELTEIPSRIDEANRSLSDIPTIAGEQLDDEIAKEQAELDRLQNTYNDFLQGDDGTAELVRQINEAKTKLEIIKSDYMQAEIKRNSDTKLKIAQLEGRIATIKSLLINVKNSKADKQDEFRRLSDKRDALIREYNEVALSTFDTSKTVCPTCGREYPSERIEEMRARFNENKSNTLAMLNERGQKTANKDMLSALQNDIAHIDADISKTEQEIAELNRKLDEARGSIVELPPVETTDAYKACVSVIANLTAQKDNVRKDKSERYNGIVDEMTAVRKRIETLKGIRVRQDAAQSTLRRIRELESREQELAAEYEKLEKTLYLCDLFIKAKVSKLTEQINDKFKTVSFRLFQMQVNGGVKEDCSVLIPTPDGRLVPYEYANNAARINAGLEIINALSAHWGVTIPVFIDNAESVTSLIDTSVQTIRLVVSEEDKALRLEVAN